MLHVVYKLAPVCLNVLNVRGHNFIACDIPVNVQIEHDMS